MLHDDVSIEKKIEQPTSYAEFSENCFSVEIPRHESSAQNPNKNQLGIEFFRNNYPALTVNSESCEQTTQVSSFSKSLTAIRKVFCEIWTTLRSLFYPAKEKSHVLKLQIFTKIILGFFTTRRNPKRLGWASTPSVMMLFISMMNL